MKLKKYRIVTDSWSGFEVQQWRWYWPFWTQNGVGGRMTNTLSSIQEAKDFIEFDKTAKGKVVWEELESDAKKEKI